MSELYYSSQTLYSIVTNESCYAFLNYGLLSSLWEDLRSCSLCHVFSMKLFLDSKTDIL